LREEHIIVRIESGRGSDEDEVHTAQVRLGRKASTGWTECGEWWRGIRWREGQCFWIGAEKPLLDRIQEVSIWIRSAIDWLIDCLKLSDIYSASFVRKSWLNIKLFTLAPSFGRKIDSESRFGAQQSSNRIFHFRLNSIKCRPTKGWASAETTVIDKCHKLKFLDSANGLFMISHQVLEHQNQLPLCDQLSMEMMEDQIAEL
jgi:hypothetical protein